MRDTPEIWSHDDGIEKVQKPLTLRDLHKISKRVALAGALFSGSLLNATGLVTGKDVLNELLSKIPEPTNFNEAINARYSRAVEKRGVAKCAVKTPDGMMLVKVSHVARSETQNGVSNTGGVHRRILIDFNDGTRVECTFEPKPRPGVSTIAKK